MLQFRQDSVKAAAETELGDDDNDDDEEEEEDEEEDEEDEEDETNDDAEKPTGKPGKGAGKGGKGSGAKDEWMKKVVAACEDKAAEDACSYEGKDGEAVE